MEILPFKSYFPFTDKIENYSAFINNVKDFFIKFLEEKMYQENEIPSFYVYKIKVDGQESYGLVTTTPADQINEKFIIPHEATLENKRDFLFDAILNEKVVTKPIMVFIDENNLHNLLYEITVKIEPIIRMNLESDGIHEVYNIGDEIKQNNLRKFFSNIAHCFVADGHHRLHTLLKIQREINPDTKLLLAIFSKNDLTVHGYHRAIKKNVGINPTEVIKVLQGKSDVVKLSEFRLPNTFDEIVTLTNEGCFAFKMESDSDKNVLTTEILDNILTQNLIPFEPFFTKKIENLDITDSPFEMIFLLYPISTDMVIQETLSGRMLPAKSTWFDPKIRSGLIVGKIFE
jgi:glutamate dehydrogenase (NADP+)